MTVRLTLLALLAAAPLAAQDVPPLEVTFPGGNARLLTADLAALPQDTARARFHDGPELVYTGPSLLAVLRLAGARVDTVRGPALSQYVLAVARDGYRVVFSLGELAPTLGNRQVVVVMQSDGAPLPDKEGPWRLWVVGDGHPSRSMRQLAELHLLPAASGP